MKITRTSPLSGIERTLELDITEYQLFQWNQGVHIQTCMSNLSAADREFVKSGITGDEWLAAFGGNEED